MFDIEINIIWFLAVVALGAVIQTITGFAMGLVTMAGIAVLGVADIAFSAAVVSFISMANTSIGLRQGFRQGDWRSEGHTSELQSPCNLVCRLLL